MSRDEEVRNKEIDATLIDDANKASQIRKVVILGPDNAGKSTIFKQMRLSMGRGFSEAERRSYISLIHKTVISSMKTLIQKSERYGPVSEDVLGYKQLVEELKGHERVDFRLGKALKALWNDQRIQTAFQDAGASFRLADCTKYFMERIDEVSKPDYLPSDEDIVRAPSPMPEPGVAEARICHGGEVYELIEVNQHGKRDKWIHCFAGVFAILFVAPISAYNDVKEEDGTISNSLREALQLFTELCSSKHLNDVVIVVLPNKFDLFEQKLARVPFKDSFPDYTGDGSAESAFQFIEDEFKSIHERQRRPANNLRWMLASDATHRTRIVEGLTQTLNALSVESAWSACGIRYQ